MPTVALLTVHHPDFDLVAGDYVQMEDTFQGQAAVKNKTFVYLPPTDGMVLDGARQSTETIGFQRYTGYLTRALFPEYVSQAVTTLVGVLNKEDPKIELPGPMRPMLENATRRGESLPMLLRRIHEHQLRFGRVALLVDPVKGRPTPLLVDYRADALINWDDEPFDSLAPFALRFAVLDETRATLTATSDVFWTTVFQARALVLEGDTDGIFGPVTNVEGRTAPGGRTYRTFTERDDAGRSPLIEPRFAGRPLEFIPLTVIGSTDLALTPDQIPLLGLSNLCLAVYRGEADHRWNLHLQGQDTLVIVGQEGASEDPDEAQSDVEVRVGAGSRIEVPIGGDAKFIGVNPAGLGEQRQQLSDDKRAAQELGARLLSPQGAAAESGEALRIRVAASTASLTSIARTAAFGLQASLRQAATWMGLDPNEVVVTPNLNFSEVRPEPRSIGDLMDAKAKGAPLSLRSIHRYAMDGDITKLSFEDEQKEIATEEPVETPAPTITPPATTPGPEEPVPAA